MLLRRLATFITAILFIASANLVAAEPAKTGTLPKGAAAVLADIKQATWIRDGKSAHVMYAFFDPNCPYCHKVFDMLRPQVERGEVEVRWIPVGYLMLTSLGKAATMLEDKNPTEALYRNERGFSQETGTFGGVEEEPVPREDTLRKLAANLNLLKRSGFEAVPALVFRGKNGKADLVRGAPPAAVLEKIVKNLE